jgi:hypothetical protein
VEHLFEPPISVHRFRVERGPEIHASQTLISSGAGPVGVAHESGSVTDKREKVRRGRDKQLPDRLSDGAMMQLAGGPWNRVRGQFERAARVDLGSIFSKRPMISSTDQRDRRFQLSRRVAAHPCQETSNGVRLAELVHDYFRDQPTKAAQRQKVLLLDIFEKISPIPISEIDQISPRVAKAYAGLHSRTPFRDIEALHEKGLLLKEGKTVRANQDLVAGFLPIKAVISWSSSPANASSPPSLQSPSAFDPRVKPPVPIRPWTRPTSTTRRRRFRVSGFCSKGEPSIFSPMRSSTTDRASRLISRGRLDLLAREGMVCLYTMNLPHKSKTKLTQAFTLITLGLVGFYVASHSPRFDQFRAVDIVLLMSAGMCFGVALSLLLRRAISN